MILRGLTTALLCAMAQSSSAAVPHDPNHSASSIGPGKQPGKQPDNLMWALLLLHEVCRFARKESRACVWETRACSAKKNLPRSGACADLNSAASAFCELCPRSLVPALAWYSRDRYSHAFPTWPCQCASGLWSIPVLHALDSVKGGAAVYRN